MMGERWRTGWTVLSEHDAPTCGCSRCSRPLRSCWQSRTTNGVLSYNVRADGSHGIADLFVPARHGKLGSEHRRASLITDFADFPEVATFGLGERWHGPVVDRQQADSAERFQQTAVDACRALKSKQRDRAHIKCRVTSRKPAPARTPRSSCREAHVTPFPWEPSDKNGHLNAKPFEDHPVSALWIGWGCSRFLPSTLTGLDGLPPNLSRRGDCIRLLTALPKTGEEAALPKGNERNVRIRVAIAWYKKEPSIAAAIAKVSAATHRLPAIAGTQSALLEKRRVRHCEHCRRYFGVFLGSGEKR